MLKLSSKKGNTNKPHWKNKSKLKFHLTPVRTACLKKSSNNNCWWEWGGKIFLTAGGIVDLEVSMVSSKATENSSVVWLSNPVPESIFKSSDTYVSESNLRPYFNCRIIDSSKERDTTKIST